MGDSKSAKRFSKFDIESLLPAAAETTPSEASEKVAQQQQQQQAQQQQPAVPTHLATPLPCALQLLSHWLQQQSQAQMRPPAEAERASSSQPQAQLSPVSNSGSTTDSSSSSWCSTRSGDALCRELNVERAAAGRRALHEFSPVVDLLVKLSSAQARLRPDNGEA
jgi:hypothetical protein